MALTVKEIDAAKPKAKAYKLFDGGGLFLLVKPNGGKYWRLKYRHLDKEDQLAIGVYAPNGKGISLAEAREAATVARKLLSNGVDPKAQQKKLELAEKLKNISTFRHVAEEWHTTNLNKWTPEHGKKILTRLENHIFPYIGSRPITDIKPFEMLDVLRKMETRGTTDIMHRIKQNCSCIFRYGIITQRCESDPAGPLKGALKPHKGKHYRMIDTNKQLPAFLQAIEKVETSEMNRLACKLLLHIFLRPGELRWTRWDEFDLTNNVLTIPAERMKKGRLHKVPLSKPVIAMLEELKKLGGGSPYILPTQNRQKNPVMSGNTMNNVIKKAGYGSEQVSHAFRAIASTLLNESGKFHPDTIERQLSHKEEDDVRAAYHRAEYWDERVKIMDYWSEFLEAQLKVKVTPEMENAA